MGPLQHINTSSKKISIPLSEPHIAGNEWKYVKECLDTGWVSSVGAYVDKFEKMIAGYVGAKYAVAVVNGTSALHVSLIVSGVTAGDEVIVPTLTFIAPVNVIRYCGASPVFMDCDPDTLCLDIIKFNDFINRETEQRTDGFTYNKKTQNRIKAVIPVHIFGHPVDMDGMIAICKERNIDVIEDATESIGSEYKGRKTGSIGKVGCFSFNGNKIITTGGGGMIVTNDERIAKRARHLTTQAKCDPLEYDHDEIGYNYRLTNIQAAMGVAQMERLDEFISIKRKNATIYRALLSSIADVKIFTEEPYANSNFWFYTISVPPVAKKPLMDDLLKKGIQVRPLWKLIHSLPLYAGFQTYKIEDAPVAYERCLNLPCSVSMEKKHIDFVADNIRRFFS